DHTWRRSSAWRLGATHNPAPVGPRAGERVARAHQPGGEVLGVESGRAPGARYRRPYRRCHPLSRVARIVQLRTANARGEFPWRVWRGTGTVRQDSQEEMPRAVARCPRDAQGSPWRWRGDACMETGTPG